MPAARFFASSFVRWMAGLARIAPAYATSTCDAATISWGGSGAAGGGVGEGAGAAVAAAAEGCGGAVTTRVEAGSVRSAQELAQASKISQDSGRPVFIGAYTYGARSRPCKVFLEPDQ